MNFIVLLCRILLLRNGYLEQPRYLCHDHTLSYPIHPIPFYPILSYHTFTVLQFFDCRHSKTIIYIQTEFGS